MNELISKEDTDQDRTYIANRTRSNISHVAMQNNNVDKVSNFEIDTETRFSKFWDFVGGRYSL